MRFAKISNGTVENVCVGTPVESGDWVDLTEYANGEFVGPGWSFDGQTFTPPVITPSITPQYNSYTLAQFIEIMTRDEALAMLATTKTDPLLEMWFELAKARNLINFNDEDTRLNAPYLVQAGVLTQARFDEIVG